MNLLHRHKNIGSPGRLTPLLEIIQEGLQLKLDIHNIKEQFLNLLDEVDTLGNPEMAPLPKPELVHSPQMAMLEPIPHRQLAAITPQRAQCVSSPQKTISAARARVRALYESRKARIRSKFQIKPEVSQKKQKDQGRQQLCEYLQQQHLNRQLLKTKQHKKQQYQDSKTVQYLQEQKENLLYHPDDFHNNNLATSTPMSQPLTNCACRCSKTDLKRFMTPIREESISAVLGPAPCCSFASGSSSRSHTPKTTSSDTEGEYVTLRSPTDSTGYYIGRRAPHTSMARDMDTSMWESTAPNTTDSGPEYTQNAFVTPRRESPARYATSEQISELYTTKSLKDVSGISRQSTCTLREQVSSENLAGAFHSTFSYPLHSTMNYPLNSTIGTFGSPTPANNDSDPRSATESKTTVSEPSAALVNTQSSKDVSLKHQSLDDTYLESYRLTLPSPSKQRRSNRSRRRPANTSTTSLELSPEEGSQPLLCKEHGLHPTFGGPCIFATTNTSTNFGDSSVEEEEGEAEKENTHVTETDCDSSYLSECVDDLAFSHEGSEPDEYVATYDSRNARMKRLRRQTGHVQLKQSRAPIGLSESDLMFEISRKHLSLEATRASLPDLNSLSTPPSEEDGNNTESTLLAPRDKSQNCPDTSYRDSLLKPNTTVVTLDQSPLSVSTTDDSPDSVSGPPAPTNSPNRTDSGGSSSRPTTDSYEYVEVPVKPAKVTQSAIPPTARTSKKQTSCRPISSVDIPLATRRCKRRSHFRPTSCASIPAAVRPGKRRTPSCPASSVGRPCSLHDGRLTGYIKRDWDSGVSNHSSSRHRGCHIVISDQAGGSRTVVQHASVSRNLQRDRKKAIVKKLKQFNNNFYQVNSTNNLQIKTLGHF